ncbi:MAG TPA: hypothetical protein VN934_05320 [Candidatus Tumulicola sp.]|nr:hypothetical protein [Candidatus Tumulicola sp.]
MKHLCYVPASFVVLAVMFVSSAGRCAEPYSHLEWRQIGPAISGGRVSATAGTDADPFLYYVGAADGGVFKTIDAGGTWQAVFEKQPVAAIGAIAIAPSNKDVVWVGTGEANPRQNVSYGDGVWLSSNGGKTWQHRGLDDTMQISKILVDPRDSNTALVGALGDPYKDSEARGVYRTSDSGKTWEKTLYVGPSTGVSDMAWDPAHPGVVFAGMWQYRRVPWNLTSGGPDDGLYRSSDGGKTWRKIEGHGLPSGLMGRIGVAVAPGKPQRVFAVIQSKQGVLWRSDDGGESWSLVSSNSLVNQRAFYFSHVAVDPTNQNRVLALSEDLAESTNGGRTFKKIARSVHVDYHAIWWSHDGKHLIVGNDGGVVLSHDGGKTWIWPGNIDIGQFYHVGYDLQVPYRVCAGLQDNASFCAPNDSRNAAGILARDWFEINYGDGMFVWPDPLDPNLLWNNTENGTYGIFDVRSQQNYDVSPYPRDFNGMAVDKFKYRWNWDSPIAFSPQNPRVAYVGANVVFRSDDRGRHWTRISPDLTRDIKEHQLASGGPITLDVSGAEISDTILDIAPSPVQAGVIWVGTDDGLVQLTTDGGSQWKNVSMPGLPEFGQVETIEASPHSAGTAFVALNRHFMGDRAPYLFETDDFGVSWRSIAANLPADQYVRAVRQDPRNPDVLYAGLEQGIWISFDRGRSWSSLQNNLPTTSIRDLRVQPRANDLILATHGRSLWIFDDLTPLQQLRTAQAAGTFLFQPRTTYWHWQWSPEETNDNKAPDNQFAGSNPDVGVMLTYYLAKPAKQRPELDVVGPAGRLVRRLAGTHDVDDKPKPYLTNHAGLNRLTWDLLENAPVKWMGAAKTYRGPDGGAEAVPGTYTLQLKADGRNYSRTVEVKPDPRAPWTAADYQARHDFLTTLFSQYSRLNVALNSLDAIRRQARERSKSAGAGSPGVAAQSDALIKRADGIQALITSNPQNDEDSILYADKVRERIKGLIDQLGESLGPPTAAQREQYDEVQPEMTAALSAYNNFVAQDLAAYNRGLADVKLTPIKP